MLGRMRIEDLAERHVAPCARLVGETELLVRYGYSAELAARDLEQELARGRDESTMLVALDGEALLGFARFVVRGSFDRSGYLRLLVVSPTAKRGGVGRALMAELERRHLEPFGITLLCSTSNDVARRFYEALGYTLVGEIPAYTGPGLDECIYFKPGRPRT